MTGFVGVRREMDGDRLTGSGEEFPVCEVILAPLAGCGLKNKPVPGVALVALA
jgi:hypothetical protein